MSETLLDKGKQNLNVAKMIHKGMESDEIYLNYIGYHLQQAVELTIKYQLEMQGTDYRKTHDIEQLILQAKKDGAGLVLTEYVEDHSDMFTMWESKTRYIKDYHLEKSKVEKALEETEKFISVVKEKYKEEKEIDEKEEVDDEIDL